jgi:uncharacterized protein
MPTVLSPVLYCDTSALMKLYVDEKNADLIRARALEGGLVVVCELTWVEMRSALSLRVRTAQTDAIQAASALQQLRADWSKYQQLPVDPGILESAGDFTDTFSLRAYDSVQLACAQRMNIAMAGDMTFCCFDKALNAAAKILGMKVLET